MIHRAVPMMPSDSDAYSLMPCASWTVEMGFFFVMVQRQSDLGGSEDVLAF